MFIIVLTTITTASGDTDRAPAEKRQRGDEGKNLFSQSIKQNLFFYKVATALEEKQRLIEEILQLPHQVFDDPSKVIGHDFNIILISIAID